MSTSGFLVQTNIDHWIDDEDMDILYSIRRRAKVKKFFAKNKFVTEQGLWDLLSKSPIFNSLTIYGTYMIPKIGLLKTKVREEFFSNDPMDTESTSITTYQLNYSLQLENSTKSRVCKNCRQEFDNVNNTKGKCSHIGKWHQAYSDCNIKCGFGLKFNIGMQHWSCCYSVNYDSPCPKSKPHTE